ncbi:class I SAM-dependent methyltransferase [Alteribacillus sp. HJP-4]|uniref:class I SAM-dependent methyltransferase n=1 Tax=Alteribacillus sp. HJP-4 TaxID=2775394 RepID=UPI0035CD1427
MIITTTIKAAENVREEARMLAKNWDSSYMDRKKRSILKWKSDTSQDIYIVGPVRDTWHSRKSDEAFFFHPGMSWLRTRRLAAGGHDPLIEAAGLKRGMSFLDCTLGLGSDSIIASFITGDSGHVTALESKKEIARVVEKGLKFWTETDDNFNRAMRRISIVTENYLSFLEKQPDNLYDVIYFDPMFDFPVESSRSLNPLRAAASYEKLNENTVTEAKRVAKKRVVWKRNIRSQSNYLGFSVPKRRHASTEYAVIELKKGGQV